MAHIETRDPSETRWYWITIDGDKNTYEAEAEYVDWFKKAAGKRKITFVEFEYVEQPDGEMKKIKKDEHEVLLENILECAAKELDEMPSAKAAPTRIELGTVAILKKDLRAHTGAQYSAGAKVYKSEALARAALKGGRHNLNNYVFVPAYAEIPND